MTIPPQHLRLEAVLRLRAREAPAAPALIFARKPLEGLVVTWDELDRWADAFAHLLRASGRGPGSRCAILLQDEPSCHAAVYGILRAGGALVLLDPRWGTTSIANILKHAEIDCLVGLSAEEAFDKLKLDDAYRPRFVPFCPAPTTAPEPVPELGTVEDLALLAFTSGTTSGPKGVMIRHRHLRAAYAAARRYLPGGTFSRFGCAFRLSGLGILGMNYFYAHEHGAATVVLPELSVETASSFWPTVARHGVDFVYLVPAIIQLLNRMAPPLATRGEPPLCVTAAAPITREAHATFQQRFGKVLLNSYGLTEASFAVFYGQRDAEGMGTLSIGPAESLEGRLVDAAGQVLEGPGQGLLQVRGPTVTDGYWRNPDVTRAIFQDGWLVTGDIAERDASGCYYIRGREKEVAIRGGFNIHLQEVDETLLNHPAVVAACSVGLPDRFSGEEVYALVKLGGAGPLPTEAELLKWCRTHLGDSRAPRRLVLTEGEVPRNGAGKVVRREAVASISAALKL